MCEVFGMDGLVGSSGDLQTLRFLFCGHLADGPIFRQECGPDQCLDLFPEPAQLVPNLSCCFGNGDHEMWTASLQGLGTPLTV